ncbi:MAG: cell division protein FtsH, partial [Limnobacter sp.]|nr:cell division protein FtsH [Limnobacter sp.]
MNNAFSKAAVWLVIALVLFTVFKQFDTRQARGGDMPYSQFMAEAQEGRIDSVVVDGRTLRARSKDGRAITVNA